MWIVYIRLNKFLFEAIVVVQRPKAFLGSTNTRCTRADNDAATFGSESVYRVFDMADETVILEAQVREPVISAVPALRQRRDIIEFGYPAEPGREIAARP